MLCYLTSAFPNTEFAISNTPLKLWVVSNLVVISLMNDEDLEVVW